MVATSADTLDLETLASSCPRLNGGVVYQARAFHNSFYNDFKLYKENCGISQSNARTMANINQPSPKHNVAVHLFPNPTTGVINVSCSDGADRICPIEVYDLGGKLILSQSVELKGGLGQLKLSADNGVYLLYMYLGNSDVGNYFRIILNK